MGSICRLRERSPFLAAAPAGLRVTLYIPDEQLAHLAARLGLRADGPGRDDRGEVESPIELSDLGRVAVREGEQAAARVELAINGREPLVIVERKGAVRVRREARRAAGRDVGRVEIDK